MAFGPNKNTNINSAMHNAPETGIENLIFYKNDTNII